MNEAKNIMGRYAMQAGTFLGGYWIVKFALFPLGLSMPFLLFAFMGLTLFVPYMSYRYTVLYRDRVCGGVITMGQAWRFGSMMYFYAALLTAVAHYIYFSYIDGGYIIGVLESQVEMMKSSELAWMQSYANLYDEALATARLFRPIDITIDRVSGNVMWRVVISLVTALIVRRGTPIRPSQPEQAPDEQ